jgi:hypothetical protein
MIKKVRTVTVGTGSYRIVTPGDLRRSFLVITGSGPLKDKEFLIKGSISHNHHPVIVTFYTVSFLFFGRKQWIQVAMEGEETCELIDRSMEEVRKELEFTQHMLGEVAGHHRIPVHQ